MTITINGTTGITNPSGGTVLDTTSDLGWGQTFETGLTRVAGTSYQNTTGRPILVLINAYKASTGGSFFVSTDDVTYIPIIGIISGTGGSPLTVVIPNLYYYKLEAGSTVTSWKELR